MKEAYAPIVPCSKTTLLIEIENTYEYDVRHT
jgi:hypothetical protein